MQRLISAYDLQLNSGYVGTADGPTELTDVWFSPLSLVSLVGDLPDPEMRGLIRAEVRIMWAGQSSTRTVTFAPFDIVAASSDHKPQPICR